MHLRGSPPPAVDCEPGGRNLGMDMDGAVGAPVEVEEEEKSEIEKLREENTKLKEEVARLSDKGRFVPLSADLLEHNPQFKRAAPRSTKVSCCDSLSTIFASEDLGAQVKIERGVELETLRKGLPSYRGWPRH